MLPSDETPLRVRFVARSVPPVETHEGRFVVEPAIYGSGQGVRHCIVAHPERASAGGKFEVIELSGDFGSYVKLLLGFLHGFDVRPQSPRHRARASAILHRLVEMRAAEILGGSPTLESAASRSRAADS